MDMRKGPVESEVSGDALGVLASNTLKNNDVLMDSLLFHSHGPTLFLQLLPYSFILKGVLKSC